MGELELTHVGELELTHVGELELTHVGELELTHAALTMHGPMNVKFKKRFCRLARHFYLHPLATSLTMYKPLIYL